MILEGLLANGENLKNPDAHSLSDSNADSDLRLEMALRRRLERMREPSKIFHPIEPRIETRYPDAERKEALAVPDVAKRVERKREFFKELRKRIAKKTSTHHLPPNTGKVPPPAGMKTKASNKPPTAFPGRPSEDQPDEPRQLGDTLASRARRIKKGIERR